MKSKQSIKNTLPSANDLPGVPGPAASPTKSKATTPASQVSEEVVTIAARQTIKTIKVPHLDGPVGYVRKRVDVTLNSPQALTLKQLLLGLEEKDAQLINGKRVTSQSSAIQWLLENAK